VRSHVFDDFAYAREQPCVVEDWLADSNTISIELTCVTHQTGSMSEGSYRNRPIIRSHATKFVACDEHCLRTQVGSAKRSGHARRSATDYDNISHLFRTLTA
jgi:hypothetical protein